MGKAVKIVLGLVAVVVIGVVIVSVLVLQNLDAIIKQVIEDVGSDVVGTPVTVSEVKFTLTDGRGEIYGLSIANPPGFQSDKAFEMDEIALQVSPASLTGPVIIIDEIKVDGARLTAEQKGATTNLSALLDGMNTTSSDEPAPEPSGEPTDVRLALKQFSFTNSSAALETAQYGGKTLDMPGIRLSDIGDEQTGLTPEQLASEMLSSVIRQAEKAVKDYLEDLVKDAAKEEVNKALDEKIGAENREKLEGLKGLMKDKDN